MYKTCILITLKTLSHKLLVNRHSNMNFNVFIILFVDVPILKFYYNLQSSNIFLG